jgi:hypothetical protein
MSGKTCKWYEACPMKRFYEQRLLDELWIKRFCKGNYKSCVRYHLEEKREPHPNNMLPNGEIDLKLK